MKSLRNHLFMLLPRTLRHAMIRRKMVYPESAPKGVRFKLAETKEELCQAFKLLHDAYVTFNYMDAHASGMRLTKYHMLPSASTLIAVKDGEVVATISLIRSSAFGLPCELAYDLQDIKKGHGRVAEISGLAIHPRYRHKNAYLLLPLVKFMVEYCRRYFGVDYLALVVQPIWFEIYSAVWFFTPFAQNQISHNYVKGAPGRGGYVKVRHLEIRAEMFYGDIPSKKNLFTYMFQREFDCFEFPRRDPANAFDPVMTPELFKYFFVEQSDLLSTLSTSELQVLRQVYSSPDYHGFFPLKIDDLWNRQEEKRFDVECTAQIIVSAHRQIPMLIRSVSKSGIGGILYRDLRAGETYVLQIDVRKNQTLSVRGKVIWKRADGSCGFIVCGRSPQWIQYIKALDLALLTPA